MRLRTLGIVGTVVLAAVTTAIGAGFYISFRSIDVALMNDGAARNIGQAVFELRALTGDYLLQFEKRAQIQWERKHESLERLLRLPGLLGAEQEPGLAVLRANHLDSGAIFVRLVAVVATEQALGERSGVSVVLEQRLAAQLLIRSQTMATAAFQLALQGEAELREATRLAVLLAILLSASIVIVVAGTWLIIALRVAKPFRDLGQGIQILAGGNLDHRIGVGGRDEIGEVARSIDEMAENLKTTMISRDELEQQVKDRTAELAGANQELQAFSYSVSHDLRAPLRTMHGFSQALLDEYGGKIAAEGKDYLKRILSGSTTMAQLIDDLLRFSRVTTGKIRHRDVDLSALARTVAADLRRTGPARQAVFDITPGVVASGDAALLQIVLEKLLDNAWKFTRNHKQANIEFGVTERDGVPVYYVRDDGAGFDMAYVDKLFQPFQRLHNVKEFEGTGIGLATVKRIVARHGGRAWADSAQEQGTTVYFTLWENNNGRKDHDP